MTSNELNALTDETVKKIIFELEKMKKYIEGDTISYTFNLYPNCKAVFNVLKPNLVI